MSKRVYFIFAHPQRTRSRANRLVLERVCDLPQVTVVDLYETYPGFHIDVDKEQQNLLSHDIVVFQHPLYWYAMPPLLKLWVDEVLELGWAYGPDGVAIAGKAFQLSITTGGNDESYSPSGVHEHPLDAFLLPYVEMSKLCKLSYLDPVVLHSAQRASMAELEAHAERVRDRLIHLTNPLYAGESGAL